MFTRPRRRCRRLAVSTTLLGVAVALALSGTASASFPVTVHAANGTVRVASRPTAIVSLSPTATEMLYAIGAGSQVKAVDLNSDYPAGAPHTQLDGNNPNVEAIATYKPDLVVASDEPTSVDTQLGALGIPVVSDPAATDLSQEYAQFEELGKLTGHEAQAQAEVAKLKSEVARIVASVHKAPHGATYYYELDQTYYSATSSTFIGQVLGLLGLHSIADAAKGAAASGGYPQLSGEFILKSNPELHPAGGHDLLRPVDRHRGAAARLVGSRRREGRTGAGVSTTTSPHDGDRGSWSSSPTSRPK